MHEQEDRLATAREISNWSRLAKDPKYNRCSQGWRGFSGESCFGYHGYFAFLAATGNVSTPDIHREFYLNSLYRSTQLEKSDDKPSVLISGLATPAMAKIVFEGIGEVADVDIIDICETPLNVTGAVFPDKFKKFNVRTKKIDVLDTQNLTMFAGDRKNYSAIATDAFLTRFTDDEKERVLSNFTKILRNDGGIITTWKYKNKNGADEGYGTERDKKIFVENVLASADQLGIGYTLDEIQAAYAYASSMTSHGGQTLEEVRNILNRHFPIVEIDDMWPYKAYDVTMRRYARIYAYNPIK